MSFLNRFLDDSPEDDELQSVRRHLGHILSGRLGFASHVHGYGLVKYSAESTSRNVAQVLLQELLDNLTTYEPRLAGVRLRTLEKDADQVLHIILQGRIRERPCIMHLAFSMTLGWLGVVDAKWEDSRVP